LHQKLKFVIDDKLIIVSGEEDLVVCGSTSTPYIEATEEAYFRLWRLLAQPMWNPSR